MKLLVKSVLCFVLALIAQRALSDDVYFGGYGDTGTHWVGYEASVSKSAITWTAYVLDPARPGKIKVAPATFHSAGEDRWTATFDEISFRDRSAVFGLAKHDLGVLSRQDPRALKIRDGKEVFNMLKVSPDELKALGQGRLPNRFSEQAH